MNFTGQNHHTFSTLLHSGLHHQVNLQMSVPVQRRMHKGNVAISYDKKSVEEWKRERKSKKKRKWNRQLERKRKRNRLIAQRRILGIDIQTIPLYPHVRPYLFMVIIHFYPIYIWSTMYAHTHLTGTHLGCECSGESRLGLFHGFWSQSARYYIYFLPL